MPLDPINQSQTSWARRDFENGLKNYSPKPLFYQNTMEEKTKKKKTNFQQNIIVFRSALMMSAKEVEKAAGIYPKRLHNMESIGAKPTIDELQILSKYFGYSVDEMINNVYYLQVKKEEQDISELANNQTANFKFGE